MKKTTAKKTAKGAATVADYSYAKETDIKRPTLPTGEYSGIAAERLIGKVPVVRTEPRPASADLTDEFEAVNHDLDPQLVWRGKTPDAPVVTPAPHIYQQEKIFPRALIEDLKRETAERRGADDLAPELPGWGDDFDPNARPTFYTHEQDWTNRLILGDSLQVMASLAENERLRGKVQTVYFDPPYGIKFNSNWQPSTASTNVRDGKTEDITREPEMVKAFRDTWKDGIHSYLGYLRERLMMARELLTESGSIFVQISDDNVHLVRSLLDEVFGVDNFVSMISFAKTASIKANFLGTTHDYILWYAKDIARAKFRPLFLERKESTEGGTYNCIEENDSWRRLSKKELQEGVKSDGVFRAADISRQGASESQTPVEFQGKVFYPSPGRHWAANYPVGMQRLIRANRIVALQKVLSYKLFATDSGHTRIDHVWNDTILGTFSDKLYVVQTGTLAVQRCLLMTTDPGDLVLDPTCGSGTTAVVAEQWGRRWITIDTSRVSLAIARRRLMTTRYPYYYLIDTEDGLALERQVTGKPVMRPTLGRVSQGFVYRRVPHVTLKGIANDSEIDTIWEKYAPESRRLREAAAKGGRVPEEWEMPFDAASDFQKMRRARQQEMDASIARTAETEYLYDAPYEDKKRVRVTGPFTVESLAPVRALTSLPDGGFEDPAVQLAHNVSYGNGANYVTRMIQALKRNGVMQARKSDRITFTRVEPYGGADGVIAAEATGTPSEKTGKSKRYAIAFGPEFGSVTRLDVKTAARRALEEGFDALIYCAFMFDAYVEEGSDDSVGSLKVLHARMNADLHMEVDDKLKDTGHGNPFVIFGEPDVAIETTDDDLLRVTIRGVDVYDPHEGEVRSMGAEGIDCWMIDTDYCGEAFFARHVYFPDNPKVFQGLKKLLNNDVDDEAWASVASTTSRPFPRPKGGKIAVKVINHYGDEVLKVFDVRSSK